MPSYIYKIFPCNNTNQALVVDAIAALPSVMNDQRATCLVKKDDIVANMGGVNAAIEFVWMLNITAEEESAFNAVGFTQVESYQTPNEVMAVYSQIFNRGVEI